MAVYDQQLLDTVFNDLDHLLAESRQSLTEHPELCVACHGNRLLYAGSSSSHPGSYVCDDCGVVQPGCVFYESMYGRDLLHKASNYKRIHHWHERVSQLLLLESQIPATEMLQIAQKLCDGSYTVINKDSIREVLRSLNMQLYIEKWLQIIFRITNVAPPAPGAHLLYRLDEMFLELQEPFNCYRAEERKNFLNYNYVFCRLFQRLNCTQFCMFFPLIKSKVKLKQLDDTWCAMTKSMKWDFTPMAQVSPFAVRLEQPELLLQRITAQHALTIPAVLETEQMRTVFRTLDRRSVDKLLRGSARRHLTQPAQRSRKLASVGKRHRLR